MKDFYNINAKSYFHSTVNNNLEELYEPFLAQIPKGGRILDLGCGSGRDAKYFNEKGFEVIATDGSKELTKLAAEHTGLNILCSDYQDLNFEPSSFDGIWCCASLLHLPRIELPNTILKLKAWLKPNGVLYASFKYGDLERNDENRFFNDLNEEYFHTKLMQIIDLEVVKVWQTIETRNEQEVIWFNLLLKK